MVRSKWYVQQITEVGGYPSRCWVIKMIPVWEGADEKGENIAKENHIFSKHTPSGSLEMTITNEAAAKQFRAGECYYGEFSPAGLPAYAVPK